MLSDRPVTYPLMLAQPSGRDPESAVQQLQRDGEWTFEFKFDGIRALVIVDFGTVKIVNRNNRDITYRYPEIVEQLTGMEWNGVIDGEIVCMDENGRPDFSRVHRRDAQATARAAAVLATTLPAKLVAFDLLVDEGVDLRVLKYAHRRGHLTDRTELLTGHGIVLPPVSKDGATMWAAVKDMGLEGLIAKRDDSRYLGRRSGAWVKIKATRRITAAVCGYDPGEGFLTGTFGCLHLALVDTGGTLVHIGSVGTGFTEADRRAVWRRLLAGETILVEVEFLEFSPDRKLRHPSFKGVRTDLTILDCNTGQMELHPTG